MSKIFNISGICDPSIHYMVDLTERLEKIRAMVDAGQYFSINRARQYGKTGDLFSRGYSGNNAICAVQSIDSLV